MEFDYKMPATESLRCPNAHADRYTCYFSGCKYAGATREEIQKLIDEQNEEFERQREESRKAYEERKKATNEWGF